MSFCPRPDATEKTNLSAVRATKTVNPPPPRTESCGPSTTTTILTAGGENTSNTIYVPGVPGPKGDRGPAAWGFKFEGPFELNKDYFKQSDEHPLASVVTYMGETYVAIKDNISQTEENPEFEPGKSPEAWSLLSQKGTGGGALVGKEKDFFDSLKDNIFDWVKNASIGDLLLAALGAAGVLWAGKKVIDMITDDGKGDGDAEAKYNGTMGFVTTDYEPPSISEILTNLCAVADGVVTDMSAVKEEPCSFLIGNVTQIRNVLDNLALAYQFEMVDTGGVLRFVTRSTTPMKTITFADMGFDDSKTGIPPAPFVSKRYQGITLPKRVTITYYAEDTDYNTVTQSANYHTFEEGQVVQLQVPVTLTHEKAKQIAELALSNSHLEAHNFSWTASYRDIELEPSDVVYHPDLGLIRITVVDEIKEGVLRFTGVDAGAPEALIQSNQDVFIPPPSTNIPVVIGYSQAFFIDPPNLNSSDTGIRIYAAVHGYDVPGWAGADIYVSENGGASYDLYDTATREATVGLVEAPTPNHAYHTWDNDTQIVVKLKTNSLLSVSDKDVLNGKNWAMVGQEMVGFANATLIGEKTYRLTRLLRGRQGTEQYIGTHGVNELFCLLDDALVRLEWEKEDRLTTKRYKVVTRGSSLDKVDGEDVMMVSNNTLMWSPLNAKVLKVGQDFQFSWNERSRYDTSLKDLATSGHDPDWAGAGVVIFGPDGAAKRKEVVTGETFTYTSAMQIADFGAVQNSVSAAIAQLSRDYGAGYPVMVNA